MPLSRDHIARALLAPPRRIDLPGARRAAVAAIVTPDLDLLFMRRASSARDPWSGHVSFPGGRVQASDPSLMHAAIRETGEELGVALSPSDLVGELDDVATPRHLPAMVVRPFVFVVPALADLRPNREVESVHRAALRALLDGDGRGEMTWSWQGAEILLPRVDFDGVRLWGMTLRVVDDLLHRLDGRGMGLERSGSGSPRRG